MNSLKNKLSNLVNVSLSDKSILARLDASHLSIFNYVKKEDVNNFFENGFNNIKLDISINTAEIYKSLNCASNYDEFINLINKYRIPLSHSKINSLITNFSSDKKQITKFCIDYLDNLKNKFLALNRKAKEIKKDKGSWNLYLCKYFLKGLTLKERSTINAPLIMYPVEIVEKNNEIYISKVNEIIDLNEKILVFLQRDSKNQSKHISDFKNINDLNSLKYELEQIVNFPIQITNDNENDFLNENKDSIAKNYNDLVIEPNLCLGIFDPTGGKLKEELSNLLASNEAELIFSKDPTTSLEEVSEKEINEEPILQIDKLDIYQRCAVRSSLVNNTIIHGPPGTGKSEVISNIIANVLYNNKNILMVSEKVAALNVLNDRLKALNIFMLSAHDLNDKEIFYGSINKLKEFIGNSWITNYQQDVPNNEIFEMVNKSLESVRDFKSSIKKLDEFENFEFKGFDFKRLMSSAKKLGGINLLKSFKENNVFEIVKEKANINNLDIQQYFQKLSDFESFVTKNNIYQKESFEDFSFNANELSEYLNKYQIDIKDKFVVESSKEYSKKIGLFFAQSPKYKFVLKDKPSKFYEDVMTFKECEKSLFGLINENFFTKIDLSKNKLRSFINVFKNSKKSHRKFILDAFVKNMEIVNKKPFSKLFYKKKLSKNDILVLDNLKRIDELNLIDYDDFEFIIKNYYEFSTLSVLHYFNSQIFDPSYLTFIDNKFNLLNLDDLNIFKTYKLNIDTWNQFNELLEIYNEFNKTFPEFLSSDLYTYLIDKSSKKNWSKLVNVISVVVKNNILDKLKKLSNTDKELVKKAFHVAGLKRRPAIFQYLSDYVNVLKLIFPIWVSRPEQVAMFFPFKKHFFNYGIFDESSQMFLERAYPLLYRCEINIIAGDDKQLRPTNFFSSRLDDEDEEYEIDDLDTEESLLDRAKLTSWVVVMLKNHYRSKSKDLIKFSSEYIYDGKLNYATANGLNNSKAVELIEVDGLFEDRINKKEADKVIETLNKYKNEFKKILVITFNANQKAHIISMLSDNKIVSKEISNKYLKDEIEVINIENVQGNEADLVILSVCYGKKKDSEKIKAQFGPIIQDGGKNRLNVAITRAKHKMIVIKSLKASDINDSNNENLMVFKKFLLFLEQINKIKTIDQDFKTKTLPFDSDFEKEVFDSLKEHVYDLGLKMLTQYEVGNKRIDIVITTKDYSKVLLGIEVDGWKYHSSKIKKFEDIERQYFLEARGYKIFRVLEHEWNYNQELVIKSIFYELDESIKNS